MKGQVIQRHGTVDYDQATAVQLYGPNISCCPPLFDLGCSDGSIGVFHTGGEYELAMRWFGLRRARAVREEIQYLQFMGGIRRDPASLRNPGVPADICDAGNCATFGAPCVDNKSCFGMLKACGDPVIDGGNSLPYCVNDPRVNIAGENIESDEQWHEMNTTEALWNMFVYNLLWGVRDTTDNKLGHYGLWSLLQGYGDARDYTYPCTEVEPNELDWGGNAACSATALTGITLNGQAIGAAFTTNVYSTLRSMFRAFRRQAARTRGITGRGLEFGDWVIMGPEEVFDCLIDCQVCYIECGNDITRMDSERAAIRLQELRDSGIGFGSMTFDGITVPFIPFDPTLIEVDPATGDASQLPGMRNADGTYNLMFLYRGAGNQRVLQPEYNPLDDGTYPTRDGGMIQMYMDHEDICKRLGTRLEWRWHKAGMMFQTLIKNIACEQLMPSQIVEEFSAAEPNCP